MSDNFFGISLAHGGVIQECAAGLNLHPSDLARTAEALLVAAMKVTDQAGLRVRLPIKSEMAQRAAFEAISCLVRSIDPKNPAYSLSLEAP